MYNIANNVSDQRFKNLILIDLLPNTTPCIYIKDLFPRNELLKNFFYMQTRYLWIIDAEYINGEATIRTYKHNGVMGGGSMIQTDVNPNNTHNGRTGIKSTF